MSNLSAYFSIAHTKKSRIKCENPVKDVKDMEKRKEEKKINNLWRIMSNEKI